MDTAFAENKQFQARKDLLEIRFARILLRIHPARILLRIHPARIHLRILDMS
jgi:hypothetical protein